MERGTYVLATKYRDGDPGDQWCIGFFDGMTPPTHMPPRFSVVDGDGQQFRMNGFRRAEAISAEVGAWILKHASWIEFSGHSMWHFAGLSQADRDEMDSPIPKPPPCTHPDGFEDFCTLACGDVVKECHICHSKLLPGKISKLTIPLDFNFDD